MAKYGKLDDADKANAAFQIMEGLNLQFHLGHHDWNMDHETDGAHHPEIMTKWLSSNCLP